MNVNVKKLVFSATFLALCFVLPFLTANNRELGTLLSLMHLPVLLCGFVCGWEYGFIVGITAPLLRSVTLGMPPMPFIAVPMAFELAAYGLIAGLLYTLLPKKNIFLYINLITAMIIGRLVYLAMFHAVASVAELPPFLTAATLPALFTGTWGGIAMQIVLIPLIIIAMKKSGFMLNDTNKKPAEKQG